MSSISVAVAILGGLAAQGSLGDGVQNITVTGILVGVIVASVEYRAEFLDPLIDDLRFTVVARNRYRAHIGR